MKFLKPVYFNDEITTVVTVSEVNAGKKRVLFKTECFNQKEELVLSGHALVIPPRE